MTRTTGMFGGLRIAMQSLSTHRMRTILAMLGVFLGALVLTGVLHVSKSLVRKAEIETAKLGPNLFQAASGTISFRRGGSVRFRGETTTFTLRDAEALIKSIPQVDKGVPYISRTMPIRVGRSATQCQLVATLPDYTAVRSITIDAGRFFTEQELERRDKVVVLGRTIAARLFDSPEAALGQTVFFYRANMKVVGIMEEKGSDLSGTDQDEQVFVPLTTYMRRMSNQDWVSGVFMNLKAGASEDAARKAAIEILRKRHNTKEGGDDFSIITAQEASQLQKKALDLVWTLGLLSSGISFSVGSLGILSIMILLVRARRLEIGIRRSVGATRGNIMGQFLMESAIMSGIGGAAGVAASAGLITLVYFFAGLPFVYDPLLIIGTCAGSVLLGLAAGAYPAWQASQLEILTVLRSSP
ncbi:ABC transporter permease [Oleidesulfovibrio sp.]|uniref:ABC transporter permease n=1 Tax=Oleidesulfovibrio sp. TaxID=2909707 RepID=UPI003A847A7F